MDFNANISKREDGLYLVQLKGKLDSETSQDFQKQIKPLLETATKGFVFDMEHLNYISSSGLGILFMVRRFTDEENKSFLMSNVQPQIKKVFDVVKALPAEAIFQSIEEIDDYLDALQKKELEKKQDNF